MITISAGTVDKKYTVKVEYEIGQHKVDVKENHVTVSIKCDGSASGGYIGEYSVTRVAEATFPLPLIVAIAVDGLLKGEHVLSSSETKKLLLAISAAMPDYSTS